MSYPVGSDVLIQFEFYDSTFALYNPSPLPTIEYIRIANGSLFTPIPGLSHPGVGLFQTTFAGVDNTPVGNYQALATTTDTAALFAGAIFAWETQVASASPADIASDVWDAVAASYNDAGSMGAKVNLIGTTGAFTTAAVDSATGATTLAEGSSYLDADGRAGTYTISGYPPFTIGQVCWWRGTTKKQGIRLVQGIASAIDTMTFEWTADDTEALESGSFSLYYLTTNSNPIKTPSSKLTIVKTT